jgi:plastocyanin
MLRSILSVTASLSLALATASCGGEGGENDVLDAAADSGGSKQPEPELNGCTSDDYVDRSADSANRTIAIAAIGLTYTPKCLSIRAGQSVRWEGSLAAHPLAPGNPEDSGPASPIEPRSSGREVEFSFPNAGVFPYYCTLHAFGAGQGMAGVIRVRTM